MLSFHWWKTQAASPYADAAVTSLAAGERRLGLAYSLDYHDFLEGQGRSGHRGIEWEEERGHAPRSDTFLMAVGSQYHIYFFTYLWKSQHPGVFLADDARLHEFVKQEDPALEVHELNLARPALVEFIGETPVLGPPGHKPPM